MARVKITEKEFKSILDDAGMYSDIYDYAAILNELCVGLRREAEALEVEGYDILAEMYEERSDKIYEALEARGLYNWED